MGKELAGMNVLVTGATGDIGTAVVEEVAGEGALPVIHFRSNREAAERLRAERVADGVVVQADLGSREGPRQLWEQALRQLGRIDGVVHCAGLRTEISLDSHWDEWHEAWRRDFQLNVQALADISRLAVRHFASSRFGRIVSIASRAGQRGYSADALPYGATKAAVINLSKSMARAFGDRGIVSTCVAPGWVRTGMAEAFIAKHGFEAAVDDIPIKDIATPKEVAEVVAFCLRPSQRSLNGATIDVNGGSYIR